MVKSRRIADPYLSKYFISQDMKLAEFVVGSRAEENDILTISALITPRKVIRTREKILGMVHQKVPKRSGKA
jgi:hypothetical protein